MSEILYIDSSGAFQTSFENLCLSLLPSGAAVWED